MKKLLLLLLFFIHSYNLGAYENFTYQTDSTDEATDENACFVTSLENYLESLNIPDISFGMGIGAFCMLTWNCYAQPTKQTNDAQTDDTEIDSDPHNTDPHTQNRIVLPFAKRIEILNRSLRAVEQVNLNMPLIACLTQGYSRIKIEKFLRILKRSVTEYNINFTITDDGTIDLEKVYPLDMSHVQLAIEEMYDGCCQQQELDLHRLIKTAIHEAGHAVSVIGKEKFVLHSVSITKRANSDGRNIIRVCDEDDVWAFNDRKDDIIISLCGGIAEQVFGFDMSWYENRYPAARRQFDECCVLAKNRHVSSGLANLLKNPGAIGDMMAARQNALYMVKRYDQLSQQDTKNKRGQIEDEVCKILEECYQKAYELIESCKAEIEQIAQLLMRHEIISGDCVYALFNTKRPLYLYEFYRN